jgi:hypothetical protein
MLRNNDYLWRSEVGRWGSVSSSESTREICWSSNSLRATSARVSAAGTSCLRSSDNCCSTALTRPEEVELVQVWRTDLRSSGAAVSCDGLLFLNTVGVGRSVRVLLMTVRVGDDVRREEEARRLWSSVSLGVARRHSISISSLQSIPTHALNTTWHCCSQPSISLQSDSSLFTSCSWLWTCLHIRSRPNPFVQLWLMEIVSSYLHHDKSHTHPHNHTQ